MDISNRALAMFLLAAIVVSLAGTLTSLNRLGSLTTTGYATSDSGTVQLNVGATISITLDTYDTIDFGSCTPLAGVDGVINSQGGANTTAICPSFTINNHTIRNDGNVDVNVTINSTRIGEANGGSGATLFLDSSRGVSALAYKVSNYGRGTNVGGCVGYGASYANFTAANTKFRACDNLTARATENSFTTDFQIVVPYDAVTGVTSTTINYYAHTI